MVVFSSELMVSDNTDLILIFGGQSMLTDKMIVLKLSRIRLEDCFFQIFFLDERITLNKNGFKNYCFERLQNLGRIFFFK